MEVVNVDLEFLFPILWWSGPVGLGIFFAGLGYLIKCAASASKKKSQDKD